MAIKRRDLLTSLGVAGVAAVGAASLPRAAFAQSPAKVRAGYLHTLAVDGQLWLADHTGSFEQQGLEMEWIQFTTGLELFQALISGGIDVLTTGAVISNFPARGQGKMFLTNCVEFGTAQLWVNADQGVADFEDLRGKKISTTVGTTAHVYLDRALRSHGLTPEDVEIVNQRMSEAVTSFISGAVPAVALWVPFNIRVRDQVASAKKLDDASAYYPEAAIISGWAAGNDYFEDNPDVLKRIIRAWLPANDFLVAKPDEALEILQASYYDTVPLSDLKEQYQAQKVFTSTEWRALYADGTVTKWLNQVTDFFAEQAGIDSPVPADEYFRPELYLEVIKA
jgi:NitT/TauT family transport system substrate-binding protein